MTITALPDVKYAKSVEVLPFADCIEGLSGDLFDVFVKPYFANKYRPLKKGDIFIARGGMRQIEFKVVAIEGADDTVDTEYCIVGDDTTILCEGDALGREEDERLGRY